MVEFYSDIFSLVEEILVEQQIVTKVVSTLTWRILTFIMREYIAKDTSIIKGGTTTALQNMTFVVTHRCSLYLQDRSCYCKLFDTSVTLLLYLRQCVNAHCTTLHLRLLLAKLMQTLNTPYLHFWALTPKLNPSALAASISRLVTLSTPTTRNEAPQKVRFYAYPWSQGGNWPTWYQPWPSLAATMCRAQCDVMKSAP